MAEEEGEGGEREDDGGREEGGGEGDEKEVTAVGRGGVRMRYEQRGDVGGKSRECGGLRRRRWRRREGRKERILRSVRGSCRERIFGLLLLLVVMRLGLWRGKWGRGGNRVGRWEGGRRKERLVEEMAVVVEGSGICDGGEKEKKKRTEVALVGCLHYCF